ncbi:hypothetical protein LCI18_006151 [Fusarium solani-melongenae]|uniref:Uncharacterized protein n=1 Tax=Fusarium solani subsp. cucurbitae TaxID=2747967 RepID=A0ACD3Z1Z9_FUSSC|nr:hypothetical protein LCI18_006151 [Fusarium solani-melongenae]
MTNPTTQGALVVNLENAPENEQESTWTLDAGCFAWARPTWINDNFFFPFDLECSFDSLDPFNVIAVQDQSRAEIRTRELINSLTITHAEMAKADNNDPFDVSLAESVFTVSNLEYFIQSYFRKAHPYYPILHPATFNYEEAPLPVLLSVFLMGACVSLPSAFAAAARHFFDLAEQVIFRQPELQCFQRQTNLLPDKQDLAVLQACSIILVLQNCRNDEQIRRRIRSERYPRLIDAIRCSGVLRASHRLPVSCETAAEWEQFVHIECCIRLAHYAYLHDSFIVCCFNLFPQISVMEMTGSMPCMEKLYDAGTWDEFSKASSLASCSLTSQSLRDVIVLLNADDWPESHNLIFDHQTLDTLYIIISALCATAVTTRLSGLSPTAYQPLRRAIKRWLVLWHATKEQNMLDINMSKSFAKYSLGLYWFAMAIIDMRFDSHIVVYPLSCGKPPGRTEPHIRPNF